MTMVDTLQSLSKKVAMRLRDKGVEVTPDSVLYHLWSGAKKVTNRDGVIAGIVYARMDVLLESEEYLTDLANLISQSEDTRKGLK